MEVTEPASPHPKMRRRKSVFTRLVERINRVFVYRTIRKAIRECAAESPILMAPCGYGWHFDRFRRDGIEIVGVDIDPEALARARTAITPAPRILDADILDLPFADGEFDFILNNRFMLHFDADFRAKAFQELARVARRYILVHYDAMSFRLFLRRLRGFSRRERQGGELRGWRKTMRRDRLELFGKEQMAAEGAAAGLAVRKLYPVSRLFSDRVYCLYEKSCGATCLSRMAWK